MGLKDIFNATKIKEENETLKSLMTPEMQEANALLSKISELQQETDRLTKEINRKQFAVNSLEKDAVELQKKIITFNDDILVREFFNVTLDEIKEVIRNNFDKTVEFIDVPDAEQYRISQRMKA